MCNTTHPSEPEEKKEKEVKHFLRGHHLTSLAFVAPGIALMYLRLQQQATCLAHDVREEAELRAKFTSSALNNIHADSSLHPAFNESMLSPIGSPKTAGTFLNLLMDWGEDFPFHSSGMHALRDAMSTAIQMEPAPGQDDVMYGRAGLLWAIQYLRGSRKRFIADDTESLTLNGIFVLSPSLVGLIVDAGRQTAMEYAAQRSSVSTTVPSLPLMWKLNGEHSLGA